MSIRNKIICALFMCAFVAYSFRTVPGDTSVVGTTASSMWSYLDPREYWKQYMGALIATIGLAGIYKYFYGSNQQKPQIPFSPKPPLNQQEEQFITTLRHIQASQSPYNMFELDGTKYSQDQIKEKYEAMAGAINPSHTTKDSLQEEARVALAKLNKARDVLLLLDRDVINKLIAKKIAVSDISDDGIDISYQKLTFGQVLPDQEKRNIIANIQEQRKKMQDDVLQRMKALTVFQPEDTRRIVESFERQLPKNGLTTSLIDMLNAIDAYMKAQDMKDPILTVYITILNEWISNLKLNGYQKRVKDELFNRMESVSKSS